MFEKCPFVKQSMAAMAELLNNFRNQSGNNQRQTMKLTIPGTRKIMPPKGIYHDLFIYGYGTPFVIGPALRRFPFDIPPGPFNLLTFERGRLSENRL